MYIGVAIDFGCRCLKDPDPESFSQAKHIDRAMRTRLDRLNGIVLIMNWRGGTGKIVNLVNLGIERKRHVVTYQLEILIIYEMLDIALRTGEKVIEAQDVVSAR